MRKSFKKVLALFLALAIVFTIPVVAFAAEDGKFDYSFEGLKATEGKWKNNYVRTIKITLVGDGRKMIGNDLVLTIGTNKEANNVKNFKMTELKVTFNNNVTEIEAVIDKKLDHGKVYNFCIKEGSFAANDGRVNADCKFSMSGNLIIETLDREELVLNPLVGFVQWMEKSEYAFLLMPFIIILRWFISL